MNKAGLTLLPRKEFELLLSDGTLRKGQFGTWALKRFGEKKKVGLTELMAVFTTNPTLSDMLDFILCAVEYKDREAGTPVLTDLQLTRWIDDYAYDTGEQGVVMALFNHASGEEVEKKSVAVAESPGENSSELLPAPVL